MVAARLIVLAALITVHGAAAFVPAPAGTCAQRMPHPGGILLAAKKGAKQENLNSRESMRERMDAARSNANVAVGRTDRKPKERAPGEMSGSNKMISFYGVVFAGLAAVSALGGGAVVLSQ
mmetsp:Transcript_20100/g.42346  ORF Transcript_20100/g.42346 Transcript_20100/m.42346 type:complete len:121 (-) Transcript_20100:243-605(-)